MDRKRIRLEYLSKLKGYPFHLLCLKVIQRLSNHLRERSVVVRNGMISDEALSGAMNSQDYITFPLTSAHCPRFFFAPDLTDSLRETWLEIFGDELDELVSLSDAICCHNVEILGFGKISLGDRIDWHKDYLSGRRWEKKYYLHLDILDLDNPSDVKIPWEISRFHHLIPLGKTYLLTGRDKYVEEFVHQINDWVVSNPPGIGINWTCAMEASIRTINWIWAFCLFSSSNLLTPTFKKDFIKSLLHHGRHIYQNLEFGKNSGNHLITNGLGLLYLGILFPCFKESQKWLDKAQDILWRELARQVYDDGVHFEGAIAYHGLILEIYSHALILCIINGIEIPEFVFEKFKKMVCFSSTYLKPDGTFPLIGDCDSGSILPRQNGVMVHKELAQIGNSILSNDIAFQGEETSEIAFWLTQALQEKKKRATHKLQTYTVNTVGSALFPEGGFFIMRDGNYYLCLTTGDPGGKGPASHMHDDIFSFELSIGDRNFIVDSGTYTYTSSHKWRTYFRNNEAHNKLIPKSYKPLSPIDLQQPFSIEKDRTFQPRINNWVSNKEFDYFDGEHSIFYPLIHRRVVFFDKVEQGWLIRDSLTGRGEEQSEIHFHFSPQEVKRYESNDSLPVIHTDYNSGLNLSILTVSDFEEKANVSVRLEEDWYSPVYGKKARNAAAVFALDGALPYSFTTVLVPFLGKIEESYLSVQAKKENILANLKKRMGKAVQR